LLSCEVCGTTWKQKSPRRLGLRVYTSRLLGRDKSLVLHGGGNTSVKIREKNLFGEEETILYVKGSGWDWRRSSLRGFPRAPRARAAPGRVAGSVRPEMVNQLVTHI